MKYHVLVTEYFTVSLSAFMYEEADNSIDAENKAQHIYNDGKLVEHFCDLPSPSDITDVMYEASPIDNATAENAYKRFIVEAFDYQLEAGQRDH
jgi:hypothetical protein